MCIQNHLKTITSLMLQNNLHWYEKCVCTQRWLWCIYPSAFIFIGMFSTVLVISSFLTSSFSGTVLNSNQWISTLKQIIISHGYQHLLSSFCLIITTRNLLMHKPRQQKFAAYPLLDLCFPLDHLQSIPQTPWCSACPGCKTVGHGRGWGEWDALSQPPALAELLLFSTWLMQDLLIPSPSPKLSVLPQLWMQKGSLDHCTAFEGLGTLSRGINIENGVPWRQIQALLGGAKDRRQKRKWKKFHLNMRKNFFSV